MSLLMLKTKNLSWQDHTLNIEVMLAPLRSTLLLNKHKTLDTKFDQEHNLYTRQKEACIKDFVVEKRLIERRRQRLLRRKRELLDARAKSAMEGKIKDEGLPEAVAQNRSNSAPSDRGKRDKNKTKDKEEIVQTALPRLALRYTPLFGGDFLRPKVFLETASGVAQDISGDTAATKSRHRSPSPASRLGDKKSGTLSRQKVGRLATTTPKLTPRKDTSLVATKPPFPPSTPKKELPSSRRTPNVKFMELLSSSMRDDEDDDEDGRSSALSGDGANIVVEVKGKTVEEKVRDFIRELDEFNSRPPTVGNNNSGDNVDSLLTTFRSRISTERTSLANAPAVANRYSTLSLDKKVLETAFNKYVENHSHDDLLKAMKLAAKMKAHIRQARNTSLVPTIAAFKSSRSFMKLLKRQQRKDRQGAESPELD